MTQLCCRPSGRPATSWDPFQLEYGERPETAAPRMRFARELADALALAPGPGRLTHLAAGKRSSQRALPRLRDRWGRLRHVIAGRCAACGKTDSWRALSHLSGSIDIGRVRGSV
ncbi:hypothetical protein GCM10027610_086340 [Dactylosporangium cerinum]